MKISFFLLLFPLLFCVRGVECQEKQLELLMPMVSKRVDVEKHFGKGESVENITWYYLKESSIKIVYSDGSCTEEWRAPVDTVVEAAIYFKTSRPLDVLKQRVSYRSFRYAASADNKGERHYYDDVRGRKYGVDLVDNVWFSLTLYPRQEFADRRCNAGAAGEASGQRFRLEDGWKGIKVFHTKRAEIEKLFSKAESVADGMFESYSTENAQVVIVFSGRPCSNESSHRGSYRFEEGTVIEYWVNLKNPFYYRTLILRRKISRV